jgi:hypothetical protein
MEKIIYLKIKTLISIGDKVKLNNVNITITQQFIDDNEELFSVTEETEKLTEKSYKEEYLLQTAKEIYTTGTRFMDLDHNRVMVISNLDKYDYNTNYDKLYHDSKCIYSSGKWAEIIEPLFKTEDGVGIYKGDDYYYTVTTNPCSDLNWRINFSTCDWVNDRRPPLGKVQFSTKEACEKWIKENKPVVKDLEYYERELINLKTPFYIDLKSKEPKLYYIKVLQLIADDLNNKNFDELNNTFKWFTCFKNSSKVYSVVNCSHKVIGSIYFDSKEKAEQAIKIMGKKLNIIFES